MKDRIKSVDGMRFVLCLCIVYFHIFHSNLVECADGVPIYLRLQELSPHAATAVECFFVMSGFFLHKTIVEKPGLSVPRYVADRFMRLWPTYFFSILICVLFFRQGFRGALFQSLMLQCTGLSLETPTINWYVSPLFWTSVFLFSTAKVLKQEQATLLIAVLAFFSYAVVVNHAGGDFDRRETIHHFLNLGLLRGLAGVGTGFLLGAGLDKLPDCRKGSGSRFVFTATELTSLALLATTWFYEPLAYKNLFIVVVAFAALLFCLYAGNGLVAGLLSNDLLARAGQCAYSVYVMQQITFWTLQKTFWKRTAFVQEHWCAVVVLSMAACAAVGFVVHRLVERPAARRYEEKIRDR